MKERLLELLEETFEEEICHLRLRLIRDAQEPRFEKVGGKILEDFNNARSVHDRLVKIRRYRIKLLTIMIEGT